LSFFYFFDFLVFQVGIWIAMSDDGQVNDFDCCMSKDDCGDRKVLADVWVADVWVEDLSNKYLSDDVVSDLSLQVSCTVAFNEPWYPLTVHFGAWNGASCSLS